MPTPPLGPQHPTWPRVLEFVAARERLGNTRGAAREVGVPRPTAQHWWRVYQRLESIPGGAQEAIKRTGLDTERAQFGWRVIKHEDGSRDSVFWKMPAAEEEDLIGRIQQAFSDIPTAVRYNGPVVKDDALLNLLNVSDLHSGMLSDIEETGEAYKTAIATQRLMDWAGDCVERAPKAKTAVVLFNGDTFHGNDQTNATPRSKHVLDVDGRFVRTVQMTVEAIAVTVDLALRKHEKVVIVIKPGNHDPTSYLAIVVGMEQRYRDDSRVEVETRAMEFWAYQFGKVLLASHHGDKAKPQQLVMFFAAQFADLWGKTKYRYLWTGHLHHLVQQEFAGMLHEQARAAAPRDAHAFNNAYGGLSEIQAITYHQDRGEVSRVRVTA